MNNKGSIKLNMRDVFQMFKPDGATTTNIVGDDVTLRNFLDTQMVTLVVTHSFGKSTDTPQKRETGGTPAEDKSVGI